MEAVFILDYVPADGWPRFKRSRARAERLGWPYARELTEYVKQMVPNNQYHRRISGTSANRARKAWIELWVEGRRPNP